MKTMLVTPRAAIMFNPEDLTLKNVNEDRAAVRSIYLISEECDVKYTAWDRENQKEIEGTMHAMPGDILINFWEDDFSKPWVLVQSEDWKNNINLYREREQKRKEEWAAKQKENGSKPASDALKDICESRG